MNLIFGMAHAVLGGIMISGLYKSAAGMMSQMDGHQVIADNLAALSVPGYRRNAASFEAFMAPKPGETSPDEMKMRGDQNQMKSMNLPQARATADFSIGRLEKDGDPLHMALVNPGFFTVEMPDKSGLAYTRNGTFHLNAAGELVTSNGWRVLGEGGGPLTVPKPAQPILVNESGQISQGPVIGKLQIVNFADPANSLRWSGGGFFLPVNPEVAADSLVVNPGVQQGTIETSNVNPVQEMVSLIQVMRSYEANQKMLAAQDGSLEQVIRQVTAR